MSNYEIGAYSLQNHTYVLDNFHQGNEYYE
jgi:hypothetical protein